MTSISAKMPALFLFAVMTIPTGIPFGINAVFAGCDKLVADLDIIIFHNIFQFHGILTGAFQKSPRVLSFHIDIDGGIRVIDDHDLGMPEIDLNNLADNALWRNDRHLLADILSASLVDNDTAEPVFQVFADHACGDHRIGFFLDKIENFSQPGIFAFRLDELLVLD